MVWRPRLRGRLLLAAMRLPSRAPDEYKAARETKAARLKSIQHHLEAGEAGAAGNWGKGIG